MTTLESSAKEPQPVQPGQIASAASEAGSKIVLLFDYPFTERDKERFGIDVLRAAGFDVEIWDFTPFIHPDVHRDVDVPDRLVGERYRSFQTWPEAEGALARLPRECFIISVVFYHMRAIRVYRALSRHRLRFGAVVVNALPGYSEPAGVGSIVARVRRLTARKAAWYVVRRLPYRWLGVATATLVVAGGRDSLRSQHSYFPISPRSEIVWTHSFDYDTYLRERESGAPVATAAAGPGVFLDEYLPFHPDYTYLNMAPPAAAGEYYPALTRFFDLLEREHGVRIVVAAHPRSLYEQHPDYFGGRSVVRGRTPALVRSASFVIAHASSALSFAALFRKPAIFVTTKTLEANAAMGPSIRELARRFGKAPIDIDSPTRIDWERELTVDAGAYARYVDEYVKKAGSPDRPGWQIVAERLKQLLAV